VDVEGDGNNFENTDNTMQSKSRSVCFRSESVIQTACVSDSALAPVLCPW
jgi:hypothetical protein